MHLSAQNAEQMKPTVPRNLQTTARTMGRVAISQN